MLYLNISHIQEYAIVVYRNAFWFIRNRVAIKWLKDRELDICRAFELSSILNASHSEDGGLIVDFFAYTFADENMNVADPMQSSCVLNRKAMDRRRFYAIKDSTESIDPRSRVKRQ